MNKEQIEIIIPYPLITINTAAWGPEKRELYKASQKAIRYAVLNNPDVNILKKWLESRKKVFIKVEFHLNKRRAHHSDLDLLLSDFLIRLLRGLVALILQENLFLKLKMSYFGGLKLKLLKIIMSGESYISFH